MQSLREEDLLQTLQTVAGWTAEAIAASSGRACRGVVRVVHAEGIFIGWNQVWTGTEWTTADDLSPWARGEPYSQLFDRISLVQLDADRIVVVSAIDSVLLLSRPSA